jgi:hypothetical protein
MSFTPIPTSRRFARPARVTVVNDTVGSSNTAVGDGALQLYTTGDENTARAQG